MFWIVSFYFAPNIEGGFSENRNAFTHYAYGQGAFYKVDTGKTGGVVDGTDGYYVSNIKFSASRSNSIFSRSSTVQPNSLRCIFIIRFDT